MEEVGEDSPLLSNDKNKLQPTNSTIVEKNPQVQEEVGAFPYYKDLMCLCISYLLIFTGYMPLQNMESTLNQTAGLGEASLACIYSGVVLAGFFAPLCIHYVGCKWSIVACFVGQAVFAACNAFPSFYTMIPSSLLIGVLSAPMWTAVGSYVTVLATDFAATSEKSKSNLINQFNGIFFLFFQSSQVTGNLISSVVLERGNSTAANNTNICGFHFCDPKEKHDNISNNSDLDSSKSLQTLVYILIGTFVLLDIIAILLVSCFVKERKVNQVRSTRESVLSTLKLHTNSKVIMLLPLFVYIGIEQAFIFGEYTKAFPGCVLGVAEIGYTMIAFGVADSAFSFVTGQAEKVVGRLFLFSLAIIINISMLITMIFWSPSSDSGRFMFYLVPGLWGASDAVWQTTTSAFLGEVFFDNLEPVFAAFRMWMALGFAVLFSTSHFLCLDIKIYVTVGFGVISMLLYYCVEVGIRKTDRLKVDRCLNNEK